MALPEFDALILGAGAAGLAAAAEIARAGRSALVLEARERVGGRIWSHHEPALPVPVELGAEFIHGRADAAFSLLQKAGAAAVDVARPRWTLRDGKLESAERPFSEIRAAIRATKVLEKKDLSFEFFLERHLRPALSDAACKFARMLVQGYDAADPRRASARAIAEEWGGGSSAEAPQFRPLGGYGTLLTALAGELDGSRVRLQLRTVVRAVRWNRRAVEMTGTFVGQPFRAAARQAIVTLPLGVMQLRASAPGAVRFMPALKEKRTALKHLAPGPVLKVVLRFRNAFWEDLDEGRYREAAFFHAPDAAFPTFWTALPVRAPLLVAWSAGPKADRLSGAKQPEIIRQALASVTSVFGRAAGAEAALAGAWVHDWQSDPYARGAYSYVTVGGGKARETLAKPLRETLYFAGEAADVKEEAGTVPGALQSGVRAARALLRAKR